MQTNFNITGTNLLQELRFKSYPGSSCEEQINDIRNAVEWVTLRHTQRPIGVYNGRRCITKLHSEGRHPGEPDITNTG